MDVQDTAGPEMSATPGRGALRPDTYGKKQLAPVVAEARNWTDLMRRLGRIGMPYACETCGNTGEWWGQSITLQIDHVNGDWRDNRRENLRHLCPNCHALTETWCRQKGRAPLAG
ncbi:putative RNA-binding Zn-ribbon protein involved in translation (DUF1610 family) [Streptomyces sp. LBL]|uniref:hypothetical protein n=1 Tax=Streptomyces sp. LBL TaxID=2940562 RepID=UPI002473D0B1|nr:hypothetical protein [Streptomyces sp. LBL]MDH6626720.1 putative RNA-binding Zn-ribbon protein involved in translation (DUF1610 family) [Streptomyces sp. LBL]